MKDVEIVPPPIVTLSEVEPKKYPEYREYLRNDFYYSCAYCSIMEYEAMGIRFEIDHYWPQYKYPHLRDEYTNLMWSCGECNSIKGKYSPNANALKKENVIIKIDEETPDDHLELKGNKLFPKTHKGQFNIEMLDLNRRHLIKLRELRDRFWKSKKYIQNGVMSLANLKMDQLSVSGRVGVLKMKDDLKKRKSAIDEQIENIIKEYARSCLTDPDGEKPERLKNRKKYLKKQMAII